MLTDTHCHLNLPEFDADREAALARAREAGVGCILIPAIDLPTCHSALALAEHNPDVVVAVGVHPNSLAEVSAADFAEIERLIYHTKVVAIGEIGIDFYWRKLSRIEQEQAFLRQIAWANVVHKPVVVHDRDAHEAVMQCLLDHPPSAGGVLHSFSGDEVMAERALAAGFYLGVGGALTYKKNDSLRALMARVPLERLLLETDAPYLSPQPYRGRRNEPAYVRLVAQQLAAVRNVPLTEVVAATTANAQRLFRWR